MRKLVVGLGVLVVIGAAVLIVAVLSLNRVVASKRERILQEARTALGRDVSVDQITLSLWGGIGVRLQNVRVADDPNFSKEDFVRAAAVTVQARLWPLLHGAWEIRRIDLQQPQIQLIRHVDGVWNYGTLHHGAASARTIRVPALLNVAFAADEAPSLLPVPIDRATIADGTIISSLTNPDWQQETRIAHLDLDVMDFRETTPIRFSIDAAVQGETRNVHLRGSIGPLANRAAIPIEMSGALGPYRDLKVRFEELQVKSTLTPEGLQVAQLSGRVFGGSFDLHGQYPLMERVDLSLGGELKDIALAQVQQLARDDQRLSLHGAAHIQLDLHGRGPDLDTAANNMTGSIVADVRDGALKNYNLVNELLGRVTGLPGIGALLSANVKPKYARLFSDPDTRFDTLNATVQLAKEQAQVGDLRLTVVATDYGVQASGVIRPEGSTDLKGTLSMSKPFSDDVVTDVKEAKYLLDDHGQLAVPFRLRSRQKDIKVEPDTEYLLGQLARGMARGGGKDLLEKLLGGHHKRPAGDDKAADTLEQNLRGLLGH